MNFLPELWNYIKKITLAIAFIAAIGGGGLIAYFYDLSKRPLIADKLLIAEGDNALDLGRYADAQRIFEAEFKTNPQNKQAAWGLKIAQIRQKFFQPEFKDELDVLYRQDPTDPYINLFMGEFFATKNQPDQAIKFLNKAIELNPKMAEAHHVLAMFYEGQGNHEAAKLASLKAIEISPTPKYRNNLGNIYFKQQHYEDAIREYGKNKEFPLSALESAQIYWRLEYLSQALSYQKQAVEWLEDKEIMSKPENREPWYIEIQPGKKIELIYLKEKQSYAYFSLSVSLYLQGDKTGAESVIKKIYDLRLSRREDINKLISADLDALVQANNSFTEQISTFKKLYL